MAGYMTPVSATTALRKQRSLPKKVRMGLSSTLVGFSIRWCRVDLRRSPNLLLLGFAESLIEGIAGPAHAEDWVTFATGR
jgi:hypothetical protein